MGSPDDGISAAPLDIVRSAGGSGDVRLTVTGELDMSNLSTLDAAMTAAVGQPGVRRVHIDLGPLRFIDSTGVSALVSAARRADQLGVEFRVLNPQATVLRVLEIVGVLDALRVKPA
jgi:anti-anti-sigma factor